MVRRTAMNEQESLTTLIQKAIDEGATTVEQIHKSIANLPLRVLEENDLLKGTAKEVRRVQNQTIGAIYDVIREVNEKVGELATKLLPDEPKHTHEHHRARKHSVAAVH
jgi:hypothetical protein